MSPNHYAEATRIAKERFCEGYGISFLTSTSITELLKIAETLSTSHSKQERAEAIERLEWITSIL